MHLFTLNTTHCTLYAALWTLYTVHYTRLSDTLHASLITFLCPDRYKSPTQGFTPTAHFYCTEHCTVHYTALYTTIHSTLYSTLHSLNCTGHYTALHYTALFSTLQCSLHCPVHPGSLYNTLHCTLDRIVLYTLHCCVHCAHIILPIAQYTYKVDTRVDTLLLIRAAADKGKYLTPHESSTDAACNAHYVERKWGSVQCTSFSVQCAVWSVHCLVCSVHCEVRIVWCSACSVACTV